MLMGITTKLFAGPLNSELRRRQSVDYISLTTAQTGERLRTNHNPSLGSPMRERFGSYMGKRRDSTGQSPLHVTTRLLTRCQDQPPLAPSRKLSHTVTYPPPGPARDAGQTAPRGGRVGFGQSFDGVLNGGESWVARRKSTEGGLKQGVSPLTKPGPAGTEQEIKGLDVHEEGQEQEAPPQPMDPAGSVDGGGVAPDVTLDSQSVEAAVADLTLNDAKASVQDQPPAPNVDHSPPSFSVGPPPGLPDLSNTEWSYLDPQGDVQGNPTP
jgi:PERQ amino acid-rich with GYF domain-containing protein